MTHFKPQRKSCKDEKQQDTSKAIKQVSSEVDNHVTVVIFSLLLLNLVQDEKLQLNHIHPCRRNEKGSDTAGHPSQTHAH